MCCAERGKVPLSNPEGGPREIGGMRETGIGRKEDRAPLTSSCLI